MTKPEELKTLIEASHMEWKSLSRQKLSDVSGYSESTCQRTLDLFKEILNEPIIEPKKNKKTKTSGSGSSKPSVPLPLEYKDDPDELLMSVSIRQLNKPDPDPRWATILIAARKAKITLKGADDTLQRLSINTLVTKLKESLPIELRKDVNSLHSDNSQKV